MQTPFSLDRAVTRTFTIVGERPLAVFVSTLVPYLAFLGASIAVAPLIAGWANELTTLTQSGGAEALFARMREHWQTILAVLLGVVVVTQIAWAIQIAGSMQAVVDAYRQRPQSLGASFEAMARATPSLFAFQLLKQLLPLLALFLPAGASAVLAASLHGVDLPFLAAIVRLFGLFAGLVLSYLAWCALSLGPAAIVAERIGPLRAIGRSLGLARRALPSLALAWLALGCAWCVSSCVLYGGIAIVTAPLGLTDPIVSSVVQSALQLAPSVLLEGMTHAFGAVLYAELSGLGPEAPRGDLSAVFA